MKNALRLTVSLALSVLFLWIAFRNVDLAAMGGYLSHVQPWGVALYVVSMVVTQLCRAFRWDVLIRPFARVNLSTLMRISNVGNMLIMVLPLRLGELARPYLLKKEAGAPLSAGMGAVVVERAIDGLLVTLLFFVTTAQLGEPYHVPAGLRAGAFIALAIFTSATLVIIVTLLTHGIVPRVLHKIGDPISPKLTRRAIGMLEAFVSGLRSLPDVRAVLVVVFWTLTYWVTNALGMYWLMCAFGWELPIVAGFTLVCVLVIGIMIPAGPGFLGPYQGAILMGLAIFGIGPSEAAAYGLLAYPLNLVVVLGMGLPYMFGRRSVHVGEIVRASTDDDAGALPVGEAALKR